MISWRQGDTLTHGCPRKASSQSSGANSESTFCAQEIKCFRDVNGFNSNILFIHVLMHSIDAMMLNPAVRLQSAFVFFDQPSF